MWLNKYLIGCFCYVFACYGVWVITRNSATHCHYQALVIQLTSHQGVKNVNGRQKEPRMITKTYYSSVLCLGWLGFLWFQCQCIDQRDAQTNFCRQGSRVTGGGTVSVCKVAIFLCKLVTCMIYLHPVGVSLRVYRCISPEVLLRLYPSYRKSQDICA